MTPLAWTAGSPLPAATVFANKSISPALNSGIGMALLLFTAGESGAKLRMPPVGEAPVGYAWKLPL